MAVSLVLCTNCSRHVRSTEQACPFCDAALEGGSSGGGSVVPRAALAVAVALSAGLVLNACYGGPRRPSSYGPSSSDATQTTTPAQSPAPTPAQSPAPAPAPENTQAQ